jgi:hypothetical protein
MRLAKKSLPLKHQFIQQNGTNQHLICNFISQGFQWVLKVSLQGFQWVLKVSLQGFQWVLKVSLQGFQWVFIFSHF